MGLLDWLFGFRPTTRTPARDDAFAAAIIERVVDATDKRLRLLSGYRRALRPGALTTLDHIRSLLQSFPGPVEMTARAWAESRSLQPFFARSADVAIPFSRSRSVRRFFAQTMADECYALLRFEHVERDVAMTRAGEDGVPVETLCRSVSFCAPTVLAPAIDLQAARIELGKRTVDFLAQKAMERIAAIQNEKKDLEEERALLKMRLQIVHASGSGLGSPGNGHRLSPDEVAALDRELEANEAALARYTSTGTLEPFLDELQAALTRPGEWIRTETTRLAIDDMNIRVEPDAADAILLDICDLHLAGFPPLASMLVRFPRCELLPERELWRDAEVL